MPDDKPFEPTFELPTAQHGQKDSEISEALSFYEDAEHRRLVWEAIMRLLASRGCEEKAKG